ncbi:MAG TPA: hypothetical protein DCQ64_05730 [Candidatus Rokubacteria bacterium]|nr:hypothetical protein [Candidatus Rokubacteria bacterium]
MSDAGPVVRGFVTPEFAERVAAARISRQAAQNAFRFSFLRCTYAGRWVAADWNPSHPLPRKLAGFRP